MVSRFCIGWLPLTLTVVSVYPNVTTAYLSTIYQTTQLRSQKWSAKDDLDGILSNMGLTPVQQNNGRLSTPLIQNSKKKKLEPKNLKRKLSSESRYIVGSKIKLRTQLDYSRNGHSVLRDYIDPSMLTKLRKEVMNFAQEEELKAWRQKVHVAFDSSKIAASCKTIEDCQDLLESLDIVEIPFLQFFNTWRSIPVVKELAYALAESASILLDVPEVRLYQDAIFWKRSVDGATPWHVDSKMAPFDTSHFITFWIALNPVPKSGTGLMFCSKSHADFALPYWNPVPNKDSVINDEFLSEWDRLAKRYPEKIVDYMPMKVGDVTVHSGWTLHCASESDRTNDRIALAISFVDAKAEIRPDALDGAGMGDNEDLNSYLDWARSVKPRMQFEDPMVPIVWPR